jgi:hypothetical protein
MRSRYYYGLGGAALMAALVLFGCGKSSSTSSGSSSSTPSTSGSASEIASAAVGGTIGATESTPTMGFYKPMLRNPLLQLLKADSAFATNACPTLLTASGSGCTNTSANIVTLNYSNCSFPSSSAVFSGTDEVETTSGITCGTYPTVPDSHYLAHQYNGTRTTPGGVVVQISTDRTNYTGTPSGSTGEAAFFTGGVRSSIVIYGMRYQATGLFDHTVMQYQSQGLNMSVSGSTRTVNGTLVVYHNLAKVTGTVSFSNVQYTAGCCQPTGGSISTVFAAGSGGVVGSLYDGKSESMTFSGTCGQATYTGIAGNSATVTLAHCL